MTLQRHAEEAVGTQVVAARQDRPSRRRTRRHRSAHGRSAGAGWRTRLPHEPIQPRRCRPSDSQARRSNRCCSRPRSSRAIRRARSSPAWIRPFTRAGRVVAIGRTRGGQLYAAPGADRLEQSCGRPGDADGRHHHDADLCAPPGHQLAVAGRAVARAGDRRGDASRSDLRIWRVCQRRHHRAAYARYAHRRSQRHRHLAKLARRVILIAPSGRERPI